MLIVSVCGLVRIGGMETFEVAHTILKNKGPRRVSPFFVPMLIPTWLLAKFQLI